MKSGAGSVPGQNKNVSEPDILEILQKKLEKSYPNGIEHLARDWEKC